MKDTRQGRLLISKLKYPHTYAEMLAYGISTSPWKRVEECLAINETVKKGVRSVNGRELVTWRVVKATRWTA